LEKINLSLGNISRIVNMNTFPTGFSPWRRENG
jgi:hypothetical protein